MKDITFLTSNGVDVTQGLEFLGDMETYNDVILEFLNGIQEKKEKIKEYKEKNDMANYAIYVHSLKSDAKYLGFVTLSNMAYNHEMASKENSVEFVSQNYDALIGELERIINVAKMYIGDTNLNTKVENDNKKTILVVDDSEVVCNIASKMLKDEYKVISLHDGSEAIKYIDNNKENIIGMLLDLNMPEVSGFDVLKHLSDNNSFEKIPVVIITGDDSKETIYKAFDYPILDVLAKPFTESDVNRVVNAIKMKEV